MLKGLYCSNFLFFKWTSFRFFVQKTAYKVFVVYAPNGVVILFFSWPISNLSLSITINRDNSFCTFMTTSLCSDWLTTCEMRYTPLPLTTCAELYSGKTLKDWKMKQRTPSTHQLDVWTIIWSINCQKRSLMQQPRVQQAVLYRAKVEAENKTEDITNNAHAAQRML